MTEGRIDPRELPEELRRAVVKHQADLDAFEDLHQGAQRASEQFVNLVCKTFVARAAAR